MSPSEEMVAVALCTRCAVFMKVLGLPLCAVRTVWINNTQTCQMWNVDYESMFYYVCLPDKWQRMHSAVCREYFFFMVQDIIPLGWCSRLLRGMKNSSKNCRRQQIVKGLEEAPKKIIFFPMNPTCFTSMNFNNCSELDRNRSVRGIHLFTSKIILVFFSWLCVWCSVFALNLVLVALTLLELPPFVATFFTWFTL